ncbi:MAG: hypothetical protein ACP5F9_09905, partial [Thiomonas sp.]
MAVMLQQRCGALSPARYHSTNHQPPPRSRKTSAIFAAAIFVKSLRYDETASGFAPMQENHAQSNDGGLLSVCQSLAGIRQTAVH